MGELFPNWITKQIIRGVRGPNLDAYLLALEGWRRGLSLKWFYDDTTSLLKAKGKQPLGQVFSLSSDNKTHFFFRSRGDKIENNIVDLETNKNEIINMLNNAKINVPKIMALPKKLPLEKAYDSVMIVGYPVILRTKYGSKETVIKVSTESELNKNIKKIYKTNFDQIIAEQYVEGTHYRVYVIEDKVVGAVNKSQIHVIGDGKSTISELIKKVNKLRRNNPYLSTRLIKKDSNLVNYISKNDYTLESIPGLQEKVVLGEALDDIVDVTDTLSDQVKDMAIRALSTIPGLKHGGVDIVITNSFPIVVNISMTPDISMHLFPLKGTPRNIPEAIIDYYFPETKNLAKDRTKIYFDYPKIKSLLEKMLVKELHVADAPNGKLYAKRYVVSGKVQRVGYRRWIRRQAGKLNLHGYTRNLKNGRVVVVVASEKKDKVKKFKDICFMGPRKAKVKDIAEYDWTTQIKAGFEIRKTST